MTYPRVVKGLAMLRQPAADAGVPATTLLLVEVRASQLNGCGVCLDMHTRELADAGESPQRLALIAAWREAPYFTDAECAALALTEAATRQPDAVPDDVWADAAAHYDEAQLGGLVLAIAGINAWNRINAVTQQPTGDWVQQLIATPA